MNRQQCSNGDTLWFPETFFYPGWVEIEGDWVNIGQHRSCARPQNGADGGEEAEGCGDNSGSRANADRGQR